MDYSAQGIAERITLFRQRFFPDAQIEDWQDWHWQMRHRLQTPAQLERILALTPDERRALATENRLPFSLTPYYAALLSPENAQQPLRRTVIPHPLELQQAKGELRDPLNEDAHRPVPGIVHRYPDRVLLLAGVQCCVYCRYCTRSRLVRDPTTTEKFRGYLKKAVQYIATTPCVRDVLISGGEPLLLSDDQLGDLLEQLFHIPHVEMVRIGTKAPMALPQRITPELCRVLRRKQPLYMSLHVIHPEELTPASTAACRRLADAGIVLGSQTVLLRGVNDSLPVIRKLMLGLLQNRVRPYYLLQCDPVFGSAHFRTPVRLGMEIIEGLRGHISGYGVPHFILDAPGGGGKVALEPAWIRGRDGDRLIIRNYEGKLFSYPDPV